MPTPDIAVCELGEYRPTHGLALFIGPIRLLLTLTSLVACTFPAEAQWTVRKHRDTVIATAAGIDGKIYLDVSCEGSNQFVALRLPGSTGFRNGEVEAQWGDKSTDTFTFLNQNETLRVASKVLITELRQRKTVRLWIAKGKDDQVTDSMHLAGSSRAIDSLPCSRPQLTDAQIKQILINRSIKTYSGNCPCPYNRDRAGRRCGGRSAYSKPGGASPLCYPGDVSDQAVKAYRAKQ